MKYFAIKEIEMTNKAKQFYYQQGFVSGLNKNPFNPDSPTQREMYYLFNAGKVDRANGWAYDEKAFL